MPIFHRVGVAPVMNSSVMKRSTRPSYLDCRRFSSATTMIERRGDRTVSRSTPTNAANLRFARFAQAHTIKLLQQS